MPDLTDHSALTLLVAFALGVLAAARFTRLATHDTWPPVRWLREAYEARTTPGQWQELATCPFCFAPYAVLGDGAWAWLGDLDPAWWAVNTWLAASYLAAMVVLRDEPPAED